jgi:uncharacterized membrane protein YfcA
MKIASSHFFGMPSTRLGWWSVRLGIVFVVMFITNILVFSFAANEELWQQTVLPFYAILMLLSGLAGGITGIIALTRWREHSLLVWFSVLLGLFVILLIVNESLQLVRYLQGP